MKAVNSNLVLSVVKPEKPKTGLVFPDELEAKGLEKAIVVSVGDEISKKVSEGDTVLIYKGAGKEFTYKEKTYRLVNISEIIVIL